MVRTWVAVVAVAVVMALAGCTSDGGSSAGDGFRVPDLEGKDWTPAGLATARSTVDAIASGIPGQCADAKVSDISTLPFGMEQVHSQIVPTAQMTCNVNDEVVEISVFASARERDRFVDDRSTGLCRLAAAQAKRYKSRLSFPGLRWDVGAGNVTVQPDSESLARRLTVITGGRYDPRRCAKGPHSDWNPAAVTALDALGAKIAGSGHGCGFVDLVNRQSFPRTQSFTDAQLPLATGNCAFDGTTIGLITHLRSTPQVEKFVDEQVKSACVGDPAVGRIDGDAFTVLAPGTIAEQVHAVVGGTLAPTSCGD